MAYGADINYMSIYEEYRPIYSLMAYISDYLFYTNYLNNQEINFDLDMNTSHTRYSKYLITPMASMFLFQK